MVGLRSFAAPAARTLAGRAGALRRAQIAARITEKSDSASAPEVESTPETLVEHLLHHPRKVVYSPARRAAIGGGTA